MLFTHPRPLLELPECAKNFEKTIRRNGSCAEPAGVATMI
jgi:hypothetical protein